MICDAMRRQKCTLNAAHCASCGSSTLSRPRSVHTIPNLCRACRRGLQSYLNQRRKLLSYLRRDNFPRYAFVLHKLGLKDTYAKQVRSC